MWGMAIENAFFSPHHHGVVQYFYELESALETPSL